MRARQVRMQNGRTLMSGRVVEVDRSLVRRHVARSDTGRTDDNRSRRHYAK